MVTVWLLFGCSYYILLICSSQNPSDWWISVISSKSKAHWMGTNRLLDHEIIISGVMWMVKNSCTTDDRKPNHLSTGAWFLPSTVSWLLVPKCGDNFTLQALKPVGMWRFWRVANHLPNLLLEGTVLGCAKNLPQFGPFPAVRSWFPKKHPSTSALNSRASYKLSWTLVKWLDGDTNEES